MDKQAVTILELLVNEYEYITYSHISNKLDISIRTVARHIKNLDCYFQHNHIRIDTKRGGGIRLILTEEERVELKKLVHKNDSSHLSAIERKIVLICELLKMREPVKSYYFSSILKVSLGTISRDLEEVEDWFNQNGLKLVRCRGNGLLLEGEEKLLREAIVNLLLSHIDNKNIHYSYIEFMSPEFFKEELSSFTKIKLAESIDYHILGNIKKIVDNYDKNIKETLVEESYFKLILLLGLMIQRKDQNFSIEEHKIKAIKSFEQYDYIIKLLRIIEKYYNLLLGDSEIYTILIYFITAKTRQGGTSAKMIDDGDLAALAYKIIANIQQDLQVKLDYDHDLVNRLIDHLKLLIVRASMNVKVTNNFLEPIKADYQHIFDVVKKNVGFLREVIGKEISDEEVGYITIHFAATLVALENDAKSIKTIVICMSGIGTSKILVEKIKQQMKNIEIVATISSSAINEIELSEQGIDLIISSVKVETFIIPVVVVNPLVRDEDKIKLNKKVNEITAKRNILFITKKATDRVWLQAKRNELSTEDTLYYLKIIHKLLDDFYYKDRIEVTTKLELFEYIANSITDTNSLQQLILKRLLKREEYGSTVIDEKGLVLLHCKAEDYLKMGVVKLASPIEVLAGDVAAKISTAFIIIIPDGSDDRILEMLSEISKALIINKDFLHEVCDGTKEAALKKISDVLLKFIS